MLKKSLSSYFYLPCEVGSKVYIQPDDEVIKWESCGEKREVDTTCGKCKKKKKLIKDASSAMLKI